MLKMEKEENLEKFLVQEEKSFSESTSGFQSGWTLYLATSSFLPPTRDSSTHEHEEEEKKKKTYRCSLMHLLVFPLALTHSNKDDCFNFYYCSNDCIFSKNEEKKRKQRGNQEESSFLDDSASSPLLCFSKKDDKKVQAEDANHAMELSCGFSVNHFKE